MRLDLEIRTYGLRPVRGDPPRRGVAGGAYAPESARSALRCWKMLGLSAVSAAEVVVSYGAEPGGTKLRVWYPRRVWIHACLFGRQDQVRRGSLL